MCNSAISDNFSKFYWKSRIKWKMKYLLGKNVVSRKKWLLTKYKYLLTFNRISYSLEEMKSKNLLDIFTR